MTNAIKEKESDVAMSKDELEAAYKGPTKEEFLEEFQGTTFEKQYERVYDQVVGFNETKMKETNSLADVVLEEFKGHEHYESLKSQQNEGKTHFIGSLGQEEQNTVKNHLYETILRTIARKHRIIDENGNFIGEDEDTGEKVVKEGVGLDSPEAKEELRDVLARKYGINSEKEIRDMVESQQYYDDGTVRSILERIATGKAQNNLRNSLLGLEDESIGEEGIYTHGDTKKTHELFRNKLGEQHIHRNVKYNDARTFQEYVQQLMPMGQEIERSKREYETKR